ncbi:MAG: diguanylate cyclase/phosphodiesterase (GGDEF & EAL domains) with PAS/PAC sensor(s) [uncultured Rubrobacteraceae bacterium]|uniref:Diguanylate cyclase/phosphodiesterase (GGDEF & EAL domains) with PAS/PAC sensor(S) n=1 Tax=uncultured Rubrobacteraceae bacterium TaxID=349277 RepID=A0A6J4R8Q4_9ACTN|nr:MAG: diguanylate cyclase/phosphodiesterase (GGDEF & EAL domains) with PAS/PAC sensor(s) [uncultured Rubrobacteraceae bacterium]
MKNGGNGAGEYARVDELRDAERRYRTVIEQSPLSIHVFSPDGKSLLANSSWNELWNLGDGEEPEGSNIFEDEQIRAMGLLPYIEEGIGHGPVTPPPLLYDPARTGREGEQRWLQAFVSPVRDEAGGVREVTLILEDVTDRKALEDRLSHQAYHDGLTGLPNRALFLDRLEQALRRLKRADGARQRVAVLFTDLDNFKYVNDTLGHEAGDELLVEVAGRIASCLRPEDTVARFGGDEFVVLLEGASDPGAVAVRISGALATPFKLNGREVFVTTSTGIAVGGPDTENAEDLVRDADVAMYRSKEAGKDRCEVYEDGMRARSSERLGLEGDMRRAVDRGCEEFVVRYQPEVDAQTGRTLGLEALVRWRHPERGLVPPDEFIPLAEETGLIVPIGRWVLGEACRRAQEWRSVHPEGPAVDVSVNLSARQFIDPGLLEDVARALGETGLDPGGLTLEITEGILTEGTSVVRATVQYLKLLGVKLAIDDFGTGYSSLAYLKRFPVDFLKIDRSIVNGIEEDPRDEAIVSAAITLAHALGERVVAEGVETEGQLARLRDMGCEVAQGFYFSKPLDDQDLTSWLAADSAR